jgi:hypothetical protein
METMRVEDGVDDLRVGDLRLGDPRDPAAPADIRQAVRAGLVGTGSIGIGCRHFAGSSEVAQAGRSGS